MIGVPVHTVPKKSGKLRLVVDHTARWYTHVTRNEILYWPQPAGTRFQMKYAVRESRL
jgi:hypothetical protein